jgi:hypothetical protein
MVYVGSRCHYVNRQSTSGSSNFVLVISIRYGYSAGHFNKSCGSWSYNPPAAWRRVFLPEIKPRSPRLSIFRQFLANQYEIGVDSDFLADNPWDRMRTLCSRDFRFDGSRGRFQCLLFRNAANFLLVTTVKKYNNSRKGRTYNIYYM